MSTLYDPQNHIVEDTILIVPQRTMHRGVAVANLIKIWLQLDQKQCLTALSELILQGTVKNLNEDGNGRITIGENDNEYAIATVRNLPERCLSGKCKKKPHDENYWILNPGAKGTVRYVIKTNRPGLAKLLDDLNRMASSAKNAIYGYRIEP